MRLFPGSEVGAFRKFLEVDQLGIRALSPASRSGIDLFGKKIALDVLDGTPVIDIKPSGVHIHEAPTGKTGEPIIPLEKTGENEWSVPSGAKLTDAQYDAAKAGGLYVNVHSNAHKGGEIRGQIKR